MHSLQWWPTVSGSASEGPSLGVWVQISRTPHCRIQHHFQSLSPAHWLFILAPEIWQTEKSRYFFPCSHTCGELSNLLVFLVDQCGSHEPHHATLLKGRDFKKMLKAHSHSHKSHLMRQNVNCKYLWTKYISFNCLFSYQSHEHMLYGAFIALSICKFVWLSKEMISFIIHLCSIKNGIIIHQHLFMKL